MRNPSNSVFRNVKHLVIAARPLELRQECKSSTVQIILLKLFFLPPGTRHTSGFSGDTGNCGKSTEDERMKPPVETLVPVVAWNTTQEVGHAPQEHHVELRNISFFVKL